MVTALSFQRLYPDGKEIPNNNSGKVQNQISVKRNSPCLSLDDGLFYAIVLLIAEQQRLARLSFLFELLR